MEFLDLPLALGQPCNPECPNIETIEGLHGGVYPVGELARIDDLG